MGNHFFQKSYTISLFRKITSKYSKYLDDYPIWTCIYTIHLKNKFQTISCILFMIHLKLV